MDYRHRADGRGGIPAVLESDHQNCQFIPEGAHQTEGLNPRTREVFVHGRGSEFLLTPDHWMAHEQLHRQRTGGQRITEGLIAQATQGHGKGNGAFCSELSVHRACLAGFLRDHNLVSSICLWGNCHDNAAAKISFSG